MKKEILYDQRALKEFKKLRREVQKDFQAYIEVLKEKGRLGPPEAKKISKDLFEIRVTRKGAYRGFYAYIGKEFVVVLHFFQKKTQKTPLKNIKLAKSRLKEYE